METGVELSDELAVALEVQNNGLELSLARRNKYHMGEQVRRSGVRAVKQANVTTWEQCELFLADLDPSPFQVIIKPVASAGSDGVYLCRSVEEVRSHFDELLGEVSHYGGLNRSLLLQEFLSGDEYVIDTVSLDGVHKCSAVWRYKKLPLNGTF